MKRELIETGLVTGASSGIGKALVIELLRQNYQVIGVSRSKEKLSRLKVEITNPNLFIYPCDVSKREEIKHVFDELKQKNIVPKIFYLNAGIAGQSSLEEEDGFDTAIHKKLFDVNYFGVLYFIEFWLESCKKNGGATFVLTSSVNAIFAPPRGSAYSASKAAISKAFDSLKIMHRKDKLHFKSIFCGPVDTPGLLSKLPFTCSARKMATYIVKRSSSKKSNLYPSLFYKKLSKILNYLPEKWVEKIFNNS